MRFLGGRLIIFFFCAKVGVSTSRLFQFELLLFKGLLHTRFDPQALALAILTS